MRSLRRKSGSAGLPGTLTPTSASLLRWWFGRESALSPGGPSFDEQLQRAITDTIVRHETASREHRLASPRYPLQVADAAAKDRVFLALLLWQLLNHNDARAAGVSDPRFTQNFVVMAHGEERRRLLDALWGQPLVGGEGARDFGTADLVRCADLLIPDARRDEVYAFVCGSEGMWPVAGTPPATDGPIVINGRRLQATTGPARLLRPLVFYDEAPTPSRRLALPPRRICAEIVLSEATPGETQRRG